MIDIKKLKLYLSDMFRNVDFIITSDEPNVFYRTNIEQPEVFLYNLSPCKVIHKIILKKEIFDFINTYITILTEPNYFINIKLFLRVINKVRKTHTVKELLDLVEGYSRSYPKEKLNEYPCFEIVKNEDDGTMTAQSYDQDGNIVISEIFAFKINEDTWKGYHRLVNIPNQQDKIITPIDNLSVKKNNKISAIKINEQVCFALRDGMSSVHINGYCNKAKKLKDRVFEVHWINNGQQNLCWVEYLDEDIEVISVRPNTKLYNLRNRNDNKK